MLDTKLKNKRRIGIAAIVATVLAAAVIMVGLYPFFKKDASKYEVPVYEESSFLRFVVQGNYVLYVETMERLGQSRIPPFDLYFSEAGKLAKNQDAWNMGESPEALEAPEAPEAPETQKAGESEEAGEGEGDTDWAETDLEAGLNGAPYEWEYARNLRDNFNSKYDGWKKTFSGLRRNIMYQVYSDKGDLLLDHYEAGDLRTAEGFVFKTALRYDQNGRMEVESLTTDHAREVKPWLEEVGSDDPMERYYEDRYLYEEGMTFARPAGMTFVYGQTPELAQQYGERFIGGSVYSGGYAYSGLVMRVFLGIGAAVCLLALILSCFTVIPSEQLKLLRVPFEIVCGAALGAVGIGFGLVGLVAVTNEGRLYQALLGANFLPAAARIMTYLWNLLCWCLPFAVACWAVLCVGSIFEIGFKRYVRERTLVGLICGWVSRLFKRVGRFLAEIDLQDESNQTLLKIVGVNFIVLAVLCSLWFFGIAGLVVYSILLFIVLRRYYTDLKMKYRILLNATNQIAEGNLEVAITENLGVFEPFKKEIQKIQSGFKVAVDEELKSQNMKTDLITNVSHDLKTPLTAIITYVNLLKEESITEEQRKSYIDVLEKKSMRLKALIEDLFEMSKATSKNITVNLVDVDIVHLLKEVGLEMNDKIEESSIEFRWSLPEEKIVLSLDSQKTYRIFENLLMNIIKYAMPNTRAFIDLKKDEANVVITMRNVSARELDFDPEDITERFVRGDQSRNTEGSGLGLAIAKSFVELQRGKMTVEVEADLFRVTIKWPL